MKRGAALLAGALCFSSTRAEADAPRFELDACVDADRAEVARIVDVELGKGRSVHLPHVRAACAEGRIVLQIEDVDSGAKQSRTLDLGATPESGKARLLALAIAELVSSNATDRREGAGLEHPPWPKTAYVVGVSEDASSAPAPIEREPLSWRLVGVVAHRSVLADAGVASWGVGARLAFVGASGLGGTFDLVGDRAVEDATLGSVTMQTLSTSAAASMTIGSKTLQASGAAGARVGLVDVTGSPKVAGAKGGSVLTTWGGPCASVGGTLRIGERMLVELGAEVGWSLAPVSGKVDIGPDVSLRGAWVGAQLGGGIFF